MKLVQIGPSSCTKNFSCDSAGSGTNSQTAKHAGVIIPKDECNSKISSCSYCAADTLFTGTVVITESCCSVKSNEEQYQNFDTACHESIAPSVSIISSISSVPSSSPSLSINPSLSTMPSPRFKPSSYPSSIAPSNIPTKQIDCSKATHYYPDGDIGGVLSLLTNHACSYPSQNFTMGEDVYRYGPSCCRFNFDTKDCWLWENFSELSGEFLYPCSFGPIVMATQEPS